MRCKYCGCSHLRFPLHKLGPVGTMSKFACLICIKTKLPELYKKIRQKQK